MNRSKFKGVKLRTFSFAISKINNRKYLRQLSAVNYNIYIYIHIYVILYVGDCKGVFARR